MKKGLVIGVLLCTVGAGAWAASPVSAPMLDTLVVTAARVPQSLKETPSTVTVVQREDLEARGATDLSEALETVAGVTYQMSSTNRSHVTIRGTESRHTLILIDGKRIGTDVSKVLYNPNTLQDMGLENVDRIEIVKGGSSALYGSEAIGGVINIITKASDRPRLSLSGQTGNYTGGEHNEYRYYVNYDSGLQDDWRVQLSYGARKQLPQYNDYGGTEYYYGLSRPLSASISYDWAPGHQVQADFSYQKSQQYRDKGIMGRYDINNRVVSRSMGLSFTGAQDDWEYLARVYRNQFVKDYFTTSAGKVNGLDYTDHKETVAELQLTKSLSPEHRVTLGGEYRKEDGISTRIKSEREEGLYGSYQKPVMRFVKGVGMQPVMEQLIGRDGKPVMRGGKPVIVPKMKWVHEYKYGADLSHHSLYIQDEWRPNDRWLVVPALRYESSSMFGHRWLPKLGVTHFLSPNERIKANFGTGFVTPGLMELYYNFDMAGRVHWVGNENLQPEKSKSYELSWEKEGDRYQTKITYFRNDIKDYWNAVKVFPKNPRSNDQHYINEAHVIAQGVEWTGSYQWNDRWELHYGYTFLDSQNKTSDRPIAKQPRHKVDLGVRYHDGRWNINVWGNRYFGYLPDADSSREDITLVNAKAEYAWDNGLRVFVGVDNLFDNDLKVRSYNGRFVKAGFRMQL